MKFHGKIAISLDVINFLLISIVSIVLKGIKGLKMDLVQIFFHVSAQLITPYLHMKFQVNILSGSIISIVLLYYLLFYCLKRPRPLSKKGLTRKISIDHFLSSPSTHI